MLGMPSLKYHTVVRLTVLAYWCSILDTTKNYADGKQQLILQQEQSDLHYSSTTCTVEICTLQYSDRSDAITWI